MSDMLRITGMASGLDVDGMVKSLMKAENVKLDKVKQSRQVIQWKQDLYRDILGDINTFKSTYFEVLKPESYMLATNKYGGFEVTSTDNNNPTGTAGVTATASTNAIAGAYTVEVAKLAKPSAITGSILNDSSDVNIGNWQGSKIGFSIDGGAAEIIQLDNPGDINSLKDNINSKIVANANLKGKIEAVVDGTKIKFNVLTSGSVKITNDTDVVTDLDNLKGKVINPTSSTLLSDLGMTNPIDLTITYNGKPKTVTIDNTKTVNDAINSIYSATSGNVIARFSQLTGQFSLSTSDTGSASTINIDKDIPALGLQAGDGIGQQDAVVNIQPAGGNKITVTKSTNIFSIDGINYTLFKENTVNTLNVTSNPQKTFDKIKSLVDRYNDIIDKVSKKISEKTPKGYAPLTDDQRKSMKDEEITAWEAKAKEGLLRGDNDLQSMLRKMRSAFFDTVQGSGVTLKEIGLDTSPDTTQGGKIIIDERKLKDAIQTKGDQVANIFAKVSKTAYVADGNNTARYGEEGIFQRINDIMADYTRPTRSGGYKKGILIEKAGIKGNSEFTNILSKQMDDKDKIITDLAKKLVEKENNYYLKFSKLEQAMQQSNSQSSWLSQQLSGGN